MSNAPFDELRRRLQEVSDLHAANAVLNWDQSTYMPPGGAAARGRQMATLSRLAHEAFTHPEVGRLLDALEPYAEGLDPDSFEARLVGVTRRDYEIATRVPSAFLAEAERHASEGYGLWSDARPANDFARLVGHLERTVDLSREYAGFFPEHDHLADPLIDASDRGMTVARLRPLFAELRDALVPLVEAIGAQAPADDAPLCGTFAEADQLDFGLGMARAFGYDLARGRQDLSPHPFATSFGIGDVRITTRVRHDRLDEALFSTLHEAGHAMYEQGVDPALAGTPLGGGTSSGVHESQSRLWENVVGRSRPFWRYAYPLLRERFPREFGGVPLEAFYRAVNRVSRSLVRTDADELTYNLHVIIRFDLECDLLTGELSVQELPEAWRERYRRDLGIVPEDDRDGVLQDVHWYAGLVGGAFQGYTLGNVLSAQFFEAAIAAEPDIPADIERGRFDRLHAWLREHIYRPGRTFPPEELVRRATGADMTVEPYLRYLREKYGDLYGLR